jgi:polo-like kinase 1
MLNTSFSILSEDPSSKRPTSQAVSRPITRSNSASKDPASKVWVVRYVDYTSKYGLGFLFNNGSAGVYFNDSTKIVLSADGKVFQYIERKKKESSFGSEHSSQKFYIDSYPMELQKKVTLLKHFRNYLLDEERANPRSMNHEQAADMNALKTAFSKDYREVNNSNPFDIAGAQSTIDDEADLPFLKKWVRTKHAILFRISNRTVQVVFYDRR